MFYLTVELLNTVSTNGSSQRLNEIVLNEEYYILCSLPVES